MKYLSIDDEDQWVEGSESDDSYSLERYWAVLDDPGSSVVIRVRVRETARGPEAGEVQVIAREGRKVTTDELRLPLASIVAEAARLAVEPDHTWIFNVLSARKGVRVDYYAGWRRSERPAHLDELFYSDVAAVYRAAVRRGDSPTLTVADVIGGDQQKARSSAGRWVMETRRRGLLGPASERRAGELDA